MYLLVLVVGIYMWSVCVCVCVQAAFSLRQVMSSVPSTSAGHLTRERKKDAERIRNSRGGVTERSRSAGS